MNPSRWCADVAGSDREKCFHSTRRNCTKGSHNYYNSLRPTRKPQGRLLNLQVPQLALLLIQHYCCCVKPTVTDGNPAIIYCNSLCATKWKQLSQSTQQSVEQITTHNSLRVMEIYCLALRNFYSLQSRSFSFVSFSLCLLILCSSPFLLTSSPNTFCSCNVSLCSTVSFFLLLFRPLPRLTLTSVPLFSSSVTQLLSSEGDDGGMLTSLVLTLHSPPLRYTWCALRGGGVCVRVITAHRCLTWCSAVWLTNSPSVGLTLPADRPQLTHCFYCLPLIFLLDHPVSPAIAGWFSDTLHSCMLLPITLLLWQMDGCMRPHTDMLASMTAGGCLYVPEITHSHMKAAPAAVKHT